MSTADAYLQQVMAERHIPGLSIRIERAGALLYEGAHGHANLEHHVALTPDSVFEIASITKLFTAQLVLDLVMRGLLTLDTALAEVLPDLPTAWAGVTVRHCLMHQSGLPSYTDNETYWTLTRRNKSHTEMIDLVREKPLMFAPSTQYHYDNTGFYLLGMLIERISGAPYADMLTERIFAPLGMAHSRANDYAALVIGRVQGYEYRDGVLRNKPFYSTSNTFSAGVVLSTVRDLSAWVRAVQNDAVLNADLRRQWWTLNPSQAGNENNGGFGVGLAWFRVQSARGAFWGHNGGIAGFASALMHFPDESLTVALLCNAGHVDAPHLIALDVLDSLAV